LFRFANRQGCYSMGAAEDGRGPTEERLLYGERSSVRRRRAVCLQKLIGNRKSIATLLIDLYFDFESLLVTL
jgi:hypothetical protein